MWEGKSITHSCPGKVILQRKHFIQSYFLSLHEAIEFKENCFPRAEMKQFCGGNRKRKFKRENIALTLWVAMGEGETI